MDWLKRFLGFKVPRRTLHDAIEEEADRKHLPNGKWYKIEAIYVLKTNPIEDYKVTIDPTPLNQPPP